MLAYSAAELERFSRWTENLVACAQNMATLFDRLDKAVCSLEAAADVIVQRHNAAVKANRTRKGAAAAAQVPHVAHAAAQELPNGLAVPAAVLLVDPPANGNTNCQQ